MIDILAWIAAHPILSVVILFIQFVIVMTIHHRAHNKYLHYVLAAWFLPQDWVVNAIAVSIIGLELPKEYTVTSRLKRWKKLEGYTGIKHWRWLVASKSCALLHKVDAGHC